MERGYDQSTKILHWVIVGLIAVEFVLAWTMPGVRRGASPTTLVNYHFSFGILILIVMCVRLVWKLSHRSPAQLPGTPEWQHIAAFATHSLLYFLLFLAPLAGWAWASGMGWGVTLFGVIPIPPIVTQGSVLGFLGRSMHSIFATGILILTGLHIFATLYHHYILRDTTLSRIIPSKRG